MNVYKNELTSFPVNKIMLKIEQKIYCVKCFCFNRQAVELLMLTLFIYVLE